MKSTASSTNIKEGSRTAAKNRTLVILSGLLFLSVAYNIWWVGYERGGNEKTINALNEYIEMSKDIIIAQEAYRGSTVDFAEAYVLALGMCADGETVNLEELGARINAATISGKANKEKLEELFAQRTEFARSTGLEVSSSESLELFR